MKRYATPFNWAKYFKEHEGVQIGDATIRSRLREAGKIGTTGRSKVGKLLRNAFYSELDVREVCANLLEDMSQVDENGFFEKGGEKYATVHIWAKYFERYEGVQIYNGTILKRLQKAGIVGITARNKVKHVLKNAFYSESDVRSACADFLADLPQADKSGFFEKDGIRYGVANAFSREFGLGDSTIKRKLEQFSIESIKGKDNSGHVADFYSEDDVRNVCAELLNPNLPQVDESGFFEKDGARYGTMKAWPRVFQVSHSVIQKGIQKSKTPFTKGKGVDGRIRDFYSEHNVRLACADALKLKELPQADKSGFFEKDGIKYGTTASWSRVIPVSNVTIRKHLEQAQAHFIKGKNRIYRVCNFYPESAVREACANLLPQVFQVDESGSFEKDGTKYRTIKAWARILSISDPTIRKNLRRAQIDPIRGKYQAGKMSIANFYSESDVREVCADLLDKRRKFNPKRS